MSSLPSLSLPWWPLWRPPSQNPTPTNQELQLQLHQHPTKSTKRGRPSQSQIRTNLQLQVHQHPTKDRRETPPSVCHQSKPMEAPATYQALSSASIAICAAVAATIPMTVQPLSPNGAFPRWGVSRLVFRVGRYVCY